jgi:hypothetical protein
MTITPIKKKKKKKRPHISHNHLLGKGKCQKKNVTHEREGEDFLTLTEILNFLDLSLVNKMMELLPSIPFLKHNIPQNQKYQYKIRNCVNPFVLSPSDISGKKNLNLKKYYHHIC